jgi:hypothetical protein
LTNIIAKIHYSQQGRNKLEQEKDLYKKLKIRIYDRFKVGNSVGTTIKSKGEFALDNLLKQQEDEQLLSEQTDKKHHPFVEITPKKNSP